LSAVREIMDKVFKLSDDQEHGNEDGT
jgi:hypothetical protein